MYISTNIGFLTNAYPSNEKKLAALLKAGFDAYDFSMDAPGDALQFIGFDGYAEKAENLRRVADDLGIVCNQTHAPFPSVLPDDEVYSKKTFKAIVRSLEVTSILGGKLCVVHPWNNFSPEENAAFFKTLEPYAKDFGVKIALENMWNWNSAEKHAAPAACSDGENFLKHLSLLDENVFCALVDVGHAEMAGLNTSAETMVKQLGKRVLGIHLHDNDCVHDNHTLPFIMNINYGGLIAALKEIDYAGDITLEAGNFFDKFPIELAPAALKLMAEVADYFRKAVKNHTRGG